MKYRETYKRAYSLIINRLMSFPTISNEDWISDFYSRGKVGDFISMQSAPPSDWQLSWISEINGGKYLLRSAMTGEMCWWDNIGVTVLKPDKVATGFDWTDRQFKFRDKWHLAIKRNYDYLLVASHTTFSDFSVTCRLRKRHDTSENPFLEEITFKDFRKVSASQLNEYYLSHSKA
tara:strand:+ start:14582 stop:15109 length:528 start_codon:yes stop_codon:yes gene_type:complete